MAKRAKRTTPPVVVAPASKRRIFISYAHDEKRLAERLAAIVAKLGFEAVWDENFRFGHGFHEQIKLYIEHAHVFMPLLTRRSSQRGWVHEEIGYANAFNVPVIPVTIGRGVVPQQMIEMVQALALLPADETFSLDPEVQDGGPQLTDRQVEEAARQFEQQCTRELIAWLIDRKASPALARYECAAHAEERGILLARYSREVVDLDGVKPQLVRQKGALSSFSIPREVITHPLWTMRYKGARRSEFYKTVLREERLALEAHARRGGCHLILNIKLGYQPFADGANEAEREGKSRREIEREAAVSKISRLQALSEFLTSVGGVSLRVAINDNQPGPENLLMIGNWFASESVTAGIGTGYRNTLFTRHAPSIETRIETFDQELEGLIRATVGNERVTKAQRSAHVSDEQTVEFALKHLEQAIKECEAVSDAPRG